MNLNNSRPGRNELFDYSGPGVEFDGVPCRNGNMELLQM